VNLPVRLPSILRETTTDVRRRVEAGIYQLQIPESSIPVLYKTNMLNHFRVSGG
jgi:hypothetical protein